MIIFYCTTRRKSLHSLYDGERRSTVGTCLVFAFSCVSVDHGAGDASTRICLRCFRIIINKHEPECRTEPKEDGCLLWKPPLFLYHCLSYFSYKRLLVDVNVRKPETTGRQACADNYSGSRGRHRDLKTRAEVRVTAASFGKRHPPLYLVSLSFDGVMDVLWNLVQ